MKENEFHKQLFLDIATNPIALPLFLVGSTIGLGGWVFSNPVVVFTGFCLTAMSGGIWTTKLLNFEKNADKFREKLAAKKRKESEDRVLSLYEDLKLQDTDTRDDKCLAEIKAIYDELKNNTSSTIEYFTLMNSVESIFNQTIDELSRVYILKQKLKKVGLLKIERDGLKKEVETIISDVRETIDTIQELVMKSNENAIFKSKLGQLRENLTEQLKAAREVDQQISGSFQVPESE